MAGSKQNSTDSSVTVTLRIPSNIYRDIKTVADEYEVSIPVSFRFYIKQLKDCYDKSQQTKPNEIQHNIVRSDNPKQMTSEQVKQKILNDWGDDD